LVQRRADALIIGPGPFFAVRSEQLAALTVRHAVPTIFQYRRFAAAGGLMSYGSDETEYFRLVGIYAGRTLHLYCGRKPLVVQLPQEIGMLPPPSTRRCTFAVL
jgi:putative ABC transport system substrate-binding protein